MRKNRKTTTRKRSLSLMLALTMLIAPFLLFAKPEQVPAASKKAYLTTIFYSGNEPAEQISSYKSSSTAFAKVVKFNGKKLVLKGTLLKMKNAQDYSNAKKLKSKKRTFTLTKSCKFGAISSDSGEFITATKSEMKNFLTGYGFLELELWLNKKGKVYKIAISS